MKRILAIATLMSIFWVSCKSETEKKEEQKNKNVEKIIQNLTTYINGSVKDENQDLILDSISLIRIDTLNEKKDSISAQYAIVRYSKNMESAIEENNKLLKIREKQERISKELGQDASEYSEKVIEHLRKSTEYNMTLVKLHSHYLKIDSLIKNKMLDSVENTGYEVIVKVYGHDSKQVNKDADSIGFYLDKNLRINTKNIDRANAKIK